MQTDVAIVFFRNEFEAEEKLGFPRLSRIPDTTVRAFLRYFRGLSKRDAELLKSAIAKRASSIFAPGCPVQLTEAESLALEQRGRSLAQMEGYKFMSLKLLKMAVGMCRSNHPAVKSQLNGFQMPEDVVRWVDGLTTCKAVALRKLVKHACASRFGFVAENLGGGNWIYHRKDVRDQFEIEIDYGGTCGQQLRYTVNLEKPRAGDPPRGLQFESLLGAGSGDWNFIAESTADQDIALLLDLVECVVRIPARLAQAGSSTEPSTAPNGGPTTRLDNSGATEGPPSVS